MSLSIPNPFLDSPAQDPHHGGGGGAVLKTTALGWRAEIHPAPVAPAAAPPSNVHRPVPGRIADPTYSQQQQQQPQQQPLSNVSHSANASHSPPQQNKGLVVSMALEEDHGPPGKDRRQKRLERNRESARLSRRRRKQYLEVLETKVTELSDEMDKGRRKHVSEALATIQAHRHGGVVGPTVARTSGELRLAATFRSQQMQSLCTPPTTKFIFWLTLQNDLYFRGGRAASERLSAARIGERVSNTRSQDAKKETRVCERLANPVFLLQTADASKRK